MGRTIITTMLKGEPDALDKETQALKAGLTLKEVREGLYGETDKSRHPGHKPRRRRRRRRKDG